MPLALYTFGQFIEPSASLRNDGFHFRNDPILARVDMAAGLIARSGYEGEAGPPSWGKQVFPRFWIDNGDGWAPSTLSLWQDIEHAMAFSYFGLHAEALKHGREWFQKPEWPPYVAWWVNPGNQSDWAEAVKRLEHLHDHGSTPFAFSFKEAFDATGQAYELDRAKLNQIQRSSDN